MDVIDPTPYYEACLFDFCIGFPDDEGGFCEVLAMYAGDCAAKGKSVGPWRRDECGEYEP